MRIEIKDTTALVIDIQEKLFPHMEQKDPFLERTLMLLQGLSILGVPFSLTEQYPKGLGPTLDMVAQLLPGVTPIEKRSFSCCDEPSYLLELERSGCSSVIVCGIETHVCVLQTVVDLLASGFIPVVVADCTTSRNPLDRDVALERMKSEGAVITTAESVLFELTRISGTDTFKAISKLVK
jgi:hypothetical protein